MSAVAARGMQAGRPVDSAVADFWLLLAVAALLSLGTVMVYSATIAADSRTLALNSGHLIKHLIHLGVGLVLMLGAWRLNLDWLQSMSRPLLFGGIVLLVVVLLVGREVNGSVRWIDLGVFQLQPSELMKIFMLVYMADYLARKQADLGEFRVGVVNVALVVGGVGLLLLLEPDFGTTAVIVATVGGMLFLAGLRLTHLLLIVLVAGALLALLVWIEPYRMARLMSYRDPWADPYGNGFQLVQALIAIGRGEWFGSGLGSSIQKLFYLPHAGNDFLAAVIGEELGATGIFTVIALYGLLLWRAFVIGRRALLEGQAFAGFLAHGIGLLLALQAAIHIGVNTGILPTKGLTLPLMSYGGSSMVSAMLAVGLLLAVDRHSRPHPGGRL
ncbi:MAG: putative lipid II flippase FtsW [Pseudomonadota bacterium]|nr:putative lipid II flippase FtsW [Pseudomonadota bacterium]